MWPDLIVDGVCDKPVAPIPLRRYAEAVEVEQLPPTKQRTTVQRRSGLEDALTARRHKAVGGLG